MPAHKEHKKRKHLKKKFQKAKFIQLRAFSEAENIGILNFLIITFCAGCEKVKEKYTWPDVLKIQFISNKLTNEISKKYKKSVCTCFCKSAITEGCDNRSVLLRVYVFWNHIIFQDTSVNNELPQTSPPKQKEE